MAPKIDMKGPMTSHRAWVNGVIKRAEKFLGGNPDGLITSGNQEAAKELIEEIELAIEEVNLLVEWYDDVHDISRRAENTIDELRKALKIFETKGAVASAVSTTLVDEEFDEEEESSGGDDDEDLEEEFDEEEESSDNDDEDAFGEPDSDPDSDEDDSDVEGAGLEKEPIGSEDDTEEMPSSDDTPDTDEEDDDDDDGELIGGDFNEEVSIIFVILLYYLSKFSLMSYYNFVWPNFEKCFCSFENSPTYSRLHRPKSE